MKKAHCNKCGVEITNQNVFVNFEVEVVGVSFAVKIEDAIPIDYDVCEYCVLDAIAGRDDRASCD